MLNFIFKKAQNNDIFFAHNLTFDGSILLNNLNNYSLLNNKTLIKKEEIYSLTITNEKKILHLNVQQK